MQVVIVDFEDSFTFNIAGELHQLGLDYQVIHFSQLFDWRGWGCQAIILGPGPGHVSDYQKYFKILREIIDEKNLFLMGICLGHQLYWHLQGLELRPANIRMHGKTIPLPLSPQWQNYFNLSEQITKVQRYNSWMVDATELVRNPKGWLIIAEQGELLVAQKNHHLTLQFHPESVGTTYPKAFFGLFLVFVIIARMIAIRLKGICNLENLDFARHLGIQLFSLDFDPRSFHFIQLEQALKIVADLRTSENMQLYFSSSPDYVIKKIIQDLQDSCPQPLCAHFGFDCSPAFAQQFGVHYQLDYSPRLAVEEHLASKLFQGVTFSENYLNNQSTAFWIENLVQWQALSQRLGRNRLSLEISGNWDSEFSAFLLDKINFHSLMVSLNHEVELSYRQIDKSKLSAYMQRLNNIFHAVQG